MNRPIPAGDYVDHFDPELPHHRAWLLAVLEQLLAHKPQALEEGGTLRRIWSSHQAGAVAAAAPVTDIPAAVAVALPLVKEFEGYRLTAYPDPESGAEPWTIGWGSTTYPDGKPVQASDRISQELADALLAGRLNVGDVLVLETRWAQQYDQDGNPKGPKIEDQAAADAVPRNVTIGFYGPLSIREGTDPAWIEATEQAYRANEAAARQQQAIPLADGEDYGDEFAEVAPQGGLSREEVPF